MVSRFPQTAEPLGPGAARAPEAPGPLVARAPEAPGPLVARAPEAPGPHSENVEMCLMV